MLIFFLNALVLCFYLEHVQRITFCRCFLIFNQAVFCVDDGVVLWLKIKKSYYCYYYDGFLSLNYTATVRCVDLDDFESCLQHYK